MIKKTVHIPGDLHKQAKLEAAKRPGNVSIEDIVTEALKQYLTKRK